MKNPKFATLSATLIILLTGSRNLWGDHRSISLTPIGSYASGIFEEGGAEIVAHDPSTQRLFVVNAQAATVDVLSIGNPSRPKKVGQIDITPFGAVANSIAVHDGLIAVAVENAEKTMPGNVVFFNRRLTRLNAVKVGALPDMLAFSPDGRWLLVANEGEPRLDLDKTPVDPEGSVSIIDMRRSALRLTQSDVRTAGFAKFKKEALDSSVRIFGPGASVAQDIEPEYIAISPDSRTAWITCQENNALAIIDIESASVRQLVGLGFKDHGTVQAETSIYLRVRSGGDAFHRRDGRGAEIVPRGILRPAL